MGTRKSLTRRGKILPERGCGDRISKSPTTRVVYDKNSGHKLPKRQGERKGKGNKRQMKKD